MWSGPRSMRSELASESLRVDARASVAMVSKSLLASV
eukprot:CAMPEP_0169196790 /NCGR_PEP_ID=MMETSP1016-20121227/7921_1 /TAXON_ID=342587 /ORGANISM="Karlodinium micrum, Strain CCMP2283" /LENGTH=36 /DNA_ID= /DNA_START= /DNA_END= /DNA_ORIENTATION=